MREMTCSKLTGVDLEKVMQAIDAKKKTRICWYSQSSYREINFVTLRLTGKPKSVIRKIWSIKLIKPINQGPI